MLAALALLPANDAQALYDQICRKLFEATSLRVEMVMNPDREFTPYELAFEKSGRYSIRSPRQGIVADGRQVWTWFEGSDTFKRSPAASPVQMPLIAVGLRGFFEKSDSEFRATELSDTVYLHRDAKRLKLEPAKANSQYSGLHWIVFVGEDGLPKGFEQWAEGLPSPLQRAEYRKLEIDSALDPKLFAWTPPAGYRDTTNGAADLPPIKPAANPTVKPNVPAASVAPTFAGTLLSGEAFDLAAVARANKLTVVSFWQSNAPTNKADLAALQKLHDKYRGKGLAILTSNLGSSDASLKSTYATLKLNLPTLDSASDVLAAEAFGIKKRPTFLLLGPDRKPRGNFPTRAALLTALAKAGYKP